MDGKIINFKTVKCYGLCPEHKSIINNMYLFHTSAL